MSGHSADRLMAAISAKDSRLCVGLDPRLDVLPPTHQGDPLARVEAFCREVCDVVAPYAVAVKAQCAYFEAVSPLGLDAMWRVARHARELGLLVIVDGKRNDIASTAEAYARASVGLHAGEESPLADAVTVNAYLGHDGVAPFITVGRDYGTGLFVLVKTSNPGSGQLQDLRLQSGLAVYQHMADLVAEWGQELMGESGYSSVGAVVGATYPEQLAELRQRIPGVPFLVPGYGFQGATAMDVAAAFDQTGAGAIVNSSRGIIYAYRKSDATFAEATAEAARAARDELNWAITNG